MTTPVVTDDVETRVLDAALECFTRIGVKKTTIEDVARQAGVDRVTVYRRVGSRDDLVQAVMSREVAKVLAELAALADRHGTLDDLVAGVFIAVVTKWRNHPLAQRMLALEPERVVMKLTVDGSTSFTMAVAASAAAFAQAAARGLVDPAEDLAVRAEIVCRIVHSLILTPNGIVPLDDDAALDAFARNYLVPIVKGSR